MKNKDLHIRLTEKEHYQLQNMAKQINVSISYFVLDSVFSNKRNIEHKSVFDFINRLSFDFTKIATNVNQISKFVNSQEYLTEQQAVELKNLLLEFNKLKLEQIALLREFREIIKEW